MVGWNKKKHPQKKKRGEGKTHTERVQSIENRGLKAPCTRVCKKKRGTKKSARGKKRGKKGQGGHPKKRGESLVERSGLKVNSGRVLCGREGRSWSGKVSPIEKKQRREGRTEQKLIKKEPKPSKLKGTSNPQGTPLQQKKKRLKVWLEGKYMPEKRGWKKFP